jgi:hypothetical protein
VVSTQVQQGTGDKFFFFFFFFNQKYNKTFYLVVSKHSSVGWPTGGGF